MSTATLKRVESRAERALRDLERDGIVLLPGLLAREQLRSAQEAFAARLGRLRWNNHDGYEQTEPYRQMIVDVLTLDQGFVDLALHPLVQEVLRGYVGERYALVEAKGWRSLPTRYDFHGWHGDSWYDQERVEGIPREVKLGFYLTDVKSGAFNYLKGTHGKQAPRTVRNAEVRDVPTERMVVADGPAGTAFLFDTSGIHRQSVPILEPRQAVFFNYRDPSVPVQKEDIEYYRYHPLLLNAAFLGELDEEDRRVLGFGNKTNYRHAYERTPNHAGFQTAARRLFEMKLWAGDLGGRVRAKLRRLLGRGK